MEKIVIFISLFIYLFFYSISAQAVSLYGHRGARGLMPENTLPSYATALKTKVDYVDMDVVMTKDHVLVVYHDLALNPDITRDLHGRWIKKKVLIKDLTLEQLQQYDVGRINPNSNYGKLFYEQHAVDQTQIPTLRNVIQFVKTHSGNKNNKKVGFQIEIKNDPAHPDWTYSPNEIAKNLIKIIDEEKIADRTEVQAFDWQCLEVLQQLAPYITTAYLTDRATPHLFDVPIKIYELGGKLWDPQDTELTQAKLDEAHRLGLKVVTWSYPEESGKVHDEAMVKKLIKMGVDGIITDRPDLVKNLIKISSHY
jgi:glycerophosphoryl diester phosphodiesterase